MQGLKSLVVERLETLGRNPFEAAKGVGLERSFINDILIDKKSSVRGNNLEKLARALEINVARILEAQGNFKITTSKSGPYDILIENENGVIPVEVKGSSFISSYDPDEMEASKDPDAAPDRKRFPKDAIIELDALGGLGDGQTVQTVYHRNGDEIASSDAIKDDYWRFPPSFVRHTLSTTIERMIVIECSGDSMEPTIKSGERVWVDTAHVRPTPDGLYAIRDQLGGIVVKRLQLDPNKPRVRIISDNPSHSPSEVGLDEITIIGKVKCGLRMF